MFTVASHYQIMVQLGLKDLSRNFLANYVIGFIICPHLILYICVRIFDVMGKKFFILETNQGLSISTKLNNHRQKGRGMMEKEGARVEGASGERRYVQSPLLFFIF